MSRRAVDLLEDGFPHGTTAGFAAGCRSAGACPAGHEHGLSCRRAQILAAGNYQYQQLVRTGEEPALIAQMLRLAPEAAPEKATEQTTPTPAHRETPCPAPGPAAPPTARVEPKKKWAVRHAWVAFAPDGTMHGPFDGQPAAINFVGQHLPRPVTAAPPAATKRRPWTDDESAQLRELNGLGFSDGEIARRLKRSQPVVSERRRRLGLDSTHERNNRKRP